jgi:hypothetical protein
MAQDALSPQSRVRLEEETGLTLIEVGAAPGRDRDAAEIGGAPPGALAAAPARLQG